MADDRSNYTPDMIRMWRVYRTVKEMCKDRVSSRYVQAHSRSDTNNYIQGYEILEEECQISLSEFSSKFGLESGAPKSVPTISMAQSLVGLTASQPLAARLLVQAFRRHDPKVHPPKDQTRPGSRP